MKLKRKAVGVAVFWCLGLLAIGVLVAPSMWLADHYEGLAALEGVRGDVIPRIGFLAAFAVTMSITAAGIYFRVWLGVAALVLATIVYRPTLLSTEFESPGSYVVAEVADVADYDPRLDESYGYSTFVWLDVTQREKSMDDLVDDATALVDTSIEGLKKFIVEAYIPALSQKTGIPVGTLTAIYEEQGQHGLNLVELAHEKKVGDQ